MGLEHIQIQMIQEITFPIKSSGGKICNLSKSAIASRLRLMGTSLKSHRLNPDAGSDTFLFRAR